MKQGPKQVANRIMKYLRTRESATDHTYSSIVLKELPALMEDEEILHLSKAPDGCYFIRPATPQERRQAEIDWARDKRLNLNDFRSLKHFDKEVKILYGQGIDETDRAAIDGMWPYR